jgi:dihydropteroate synthase
MAEPEPARTPARRLRTPAVLRSDQPVPVIMGVLNMTPDSFSDGGEYNRLDSAIGHAVALTEAGAGLIDVGGESTRPGAERLPVETEQSRVLPIIRDWWSGGSSSASTR